MYFKKLEITGFKSFAERTILYFEPGVTAVVGPNGCGKSNIIDAIKWVLGEQSVKSLRGSRMEDVIFNGTEEKEPINMAEVSLTFSNRDGLLAIDSDEVVISRKIFRSGESEYLLNKTPVRLKDVQELLMGTGIGASMYSIIEQGKIGMILSSRPEERRYIFEEASGITKYKAKKREAIRKLEATDSNLLRLNDIINEVNRQINSITRQARKAERYKQRYDRLKDLEIEIASQEYSALKDETAALEGRSRNLKEEISGITRLSDELKSELNSRKGSFESVDEHHNRLQNRIYQLDSSVEQSKNRIAVNRERIEEMSERMKVLSAETGGLEIKKTESEKAACVLEERLASVTDSLSAKKEFLRDQKETFESIECSIKDKEKGITDNKEKIVDFMQERTRSKNETVRLASDVHNRQTRLRRLEMELEKVAKETEAIAERRDNARKEFEATESRLNSVRSERDMLAEENGRAQSSMDEALRILQEKRDALIRLESKKVFLEDLIDKNEGFTAGAKEILDLMKSGNEIARGIKGILGSMIEVSPGYETACEAALGENAQDVIVRDKSDAASAAEYLRDNRKGKATFLIYNEIPDADSFSGSPAPVGVSARLMDLIRVDEDLKNVLGFLLKDTYVVDSLDAAERIAAGLSGHESESVKLVTKTGEVVRKGFMTAGASPKGEEAGIIGREARLQETLEVMERLSQEIEQLEARKRELEESLSAVKKRLAGLEDLLKDEEVEYHKKESALSAIEGEEGKLREELALVNLEKEEVSEEIGDYTDRKERLEARLKELEDVEYRTQNFIVSSQESVKEMAKQREGILVLLAKINAEISGLTRESSGIAERLSHERSSYQEYSQSLSQKLSDIENSAKKREELLQEIDESEKEISTLSGELETDRKELREASAAKSESGAVIKEMEGRLNGYFSKMQDVKQSDHDLDLKKREADYKIETLKSRMSQLYKVDIISGARDVTGIEDWDTVRREIEELTRKLESMGTVNLVAIEEHKELEDRFNFLSQQRGDLTKAKEDLQKAISRINKETRRMFLETFEKIQFEFKNYFKYLFGGGQAEAFLLDENDVLESGIEIVARPPGKKLQNITLLSGGEKALTAVALIFAIFKIKPSPFCLLDEVDAPLDESNIDRFGKAILEFTKKSQFIVITHNKITITLADVMYGITMEKSGVTKIVSVKFQDKKKAGHETPYAGGIDRNSPQSSETAASGNEEADANAEDEMKEPL